MDEDFEEINTGRAFYDLEVWKKARVLRNGIILLTKQFPPEEKFALTDQMKRAVRSVPACIAEGHGRYTYKDQIHFCIMSRGSLSETLNHLIDAYDQEYITEELMKEYQNKTEEVTKILNGYIAYLRKKIKC